MTGRTGTPSPEKPEMKTDQPDDIGEIFRDGTRLDEALNRASLEAKRQHQRLGLPAAVWRDGEVVWVPADELDDRPEKPRSRRVGLAPP